mgnify:CR=1 FL=1
MNRVTVNALMQQATSTYPTMMAALLSAMRTHQRNDEPARAGTTPAAIPLAMACVLAVRMADNPDALDLAVVLFSGGIAMQRGELLPGQGAEMAAEVLSRLEEGGVI